MNMTPASPSLPSPDQTWAHSTCSVADLMRALEDDSITAIEADIVMGTCCVGTTTTTTTGLSAKDSSADVTGPVIPIMAHPPERTSDLSFRSFLELATHHDERGRRRRRKHLKLDIKEEECIRTVLDELRRMPTTGEGSAPAGDESGNAPFIFFNADILPGPGSRKGPGNVSAGELIGPCMEYMALEDGRGRATCAFSLGWRTDPRSLLGYTKEDAGAMERTIRDYDLADTGVVLAVNARVLSKSLRALDGLMAAFPSCQVLVWTATGEPPISAALRRKIWNHFDAVGCGERVGFDCNVREIFG